MNLSLQKCYQPEAQQLIASRCVRAFHQLAWIAC
jgi:hypothetical protein